MGTVKKLFALDEGIARELEIVAAAINKSQKEVVETALDFYFDYTDGIVADKITEEIKSGKMKVHNSNEVYNKLGIDL
jgi:predicted DNA-binding protein